MSINFHAYQCRNYLLSDYEEIEKQWQKSFSGYDPSRVMHILDLKRDDIYLYIRYFGVLYRLRLSDGLLEKQLSGPENTSSREELSEPESSFLHETASRKEMAHKLKKKTSAFHSSSSYLNLNKQNADRLYLCEEDCPSDPDNGWTDRIYFNEAMAVYHLLFYVKDTPSLNGSWLPNSQLDTRAGGNSRQKDMLLETFSHEFSGKSDLLEEACQKAGGIPVKTKADLSYQFYPFPQVPIQLLFWEEDEDFPAQTQIMVDTQITDYVHPDTTGCMAADLMKMLKMMIGMDGQK